MAVLLLALPASAAAEPLPSGTTFQSEAIRAQQADEFQNPGMLWVGDGERLWRETAGAAKMSCADCHGDAASMKGVAARYPALHATSGTLLNLEGRINRCRTDNQQAPALDYESDELLALTAFVARQSLGQPIQVETGGKAAPFVEAGETFFRTRRGQLNLACADCHERNAGKRLRGDVISHGLGNGYPIYRIEWQKMGSLHRRFKSCLFGVRARQYEAGSPEFLALELYLAKRAEGVSIETPAVRP